MEDRFEMAAAAPNLESAIPEHRLICRVCEKQYSKYTCPRCNSRYCSLPCYKNHSLRCTESFMRDNVTEEMRDIQSTKESQKSMMEALTRIHFDEAGRSVLEDEHEEADSDDNNGTILSDKTLELIADGGEISLDSLSLDERKSFFRAVASGEISHLIQPWNPWWLNPLAGSISITRQGTRLVRPVEALQEQAEDVFRSEELLSTSAEVPAPPSDALPEVRELLHGDPSPLLSVQLAEIIYSYCFTLRFCNGDWQSESLDSALILLSISQVLDQAASPDSIGFAFAETVKTVCSPTFKHAGGFRFAVSLFDDAATLLRLGRACVVCTLADLTRMLESAKLNLKAELQFKKKGRIKHAINDIPGHSNVSSKSSCTADVKPRIDTDASQHVVKGISREIGTQRNTYAELKKRRERKEHFYGRHASPLREVETMEKFPLCPPKLSTGGSSENINKDRKARKSNGELRKLSHAIRKVYFLMCWANEQPIDEFLSLASLIGVEKERLLEIGTINNSGLQIVEGAKALVTKGDPTMDKVVHVQEYFETETTKRAEWTVLNRSTATITRS